MIAEGSVVDQIANALLNEPFAFALGLLVGFLLSNRFQLVRRKHDDDA